MQDCVLLSLVFSTTFSTVRQPSAGTGGDLLKSRHNSGTGSVLGGPYSDVSSLLESGQTTEDGCEGDISDSDNDCSDWLQDFELVEPFLPEFWLIMRVSDDRVDTFFHCRYVM